MCGVEMPFQSFVAQETRDIVSMKRTEAKMCSLLVSYLIPFANETLFVILPHVLVQLVFAEKAFTAKGTQRMGIYLRSVS